MEGKEYYNVNLTVNGKEVTGSVTAETSLLDFLRSKNYIEVKKGCDKGDCGACTVLIDGKATVSCLTSVLQAQGKQIHTLKSLGSWDKLHPLQDAFVKHEALQCGFCTPGMLMTAKALLDENPKPTRDEIKEAISGNLCRCTGYKKIVDAIEAVSKGEK